MANWWGLGTNLGSNKDVNYEEERRKVKEELQDKGYLVWEEEYDARFLMIERILGNGKKQRTRVAYYEVEKIEDPMYPKWSIEYDKIEENAIKYKSLLFNRVGYVDVYVRDGKEFIKKSQNWIDITDSGWRNPKHDLWEDESFNLFAGNEIIASEYLPTIGTKIKNKIDDKNLAMYELMNGKFLWKNMIVDEDFLKGWRNTDKSGKCCIKYESEWNNQRDIPTSTNLYYILVEDTSFYARKINEYLPFDKKAKNKELTGKKWLCKYNKFEYNGRTIEFLTPVRSVESSELRTRVEQEVTFENASELLGIKNKEENKMEQNQEVNTIDIAQLGAEIGMEAKEQTLPNGKVVQSLVWDQENLLKAVNAVKHLSEEGTPVQITGAAPAWLVSALTHTVHPCPVGVYVPQIGKNVDIPQLAHGEVNPEGEVKFKTTEKGNAVLVEYNMDLPEGVTTYDENNLLKVVVPEIAQGKEVYISGRGPNYLTVAIAEAYAHTNSSVSLFQPGVGYTCSITHSRAKKLGDLTKDPMGKEEIKKDLSQVKANVLDEGPSID